MEFLVTHSSSLIWGSNMGWRYTINFAVSAIMILHLNGTTAEASVFSAVRIASGLSAPIYVTAPPSDTDRLFIAEKNSGKIKILNLRTGSVNTTPFLTVSNISTSGERGLLGLAFHPRYDQNGYFYINVTDSEGDTNIRRFSVSEDADMAEPDSSHLVLKIPQPLSNHNGGWLGFGPEGLLYIATGDGGGANDPGDRAQDLSQLLGKILRIDIDDDGFPADSDRNYAVPENNPFIGLPGAAGEIWAYGLRNPWRVSFDRATGDLYLGDVGQKTREEINFQPADSIGGENYGWRLREGSIATPTGGVGGPRPSGNKDPIYDYPHGRARFQGNSVTGGYVYRGPIAALQGKYFFADFVSQQIWSLEHNGREATILIDWTETLSPDTGNIGKIASFGEDALGHLYIVDIDGEIFRIVSSPAPLPALNILLLNDGTGG